MKNLFSFLKAIPKIYFIVLFILIVSVVLRFHNYTQNPPRGASSDEYTYSFMGVSLLTKGVPTTWSNLAEYQKYGAKRQDLTIENIYFPLVTPYFDHPPLNGIIVGAWAILNGEDTFEKVKLSTIRQVPIFLSILTSLLIFLLAKKIYDEKVAIWALLIYTSSPIIIMNTRTVFAENLVTPIFLLSIYLVYSVKKLLHRHFIILGLFSGLAVWAKEFGLVVFLSLLAYFVYQKVNFRGIIIFTFISIFIMLLYPLYGYFYNWELYKAVILHQSSRILGPNILYTLFFHPIIVNKIYFDGWYFLGFISLFSALKEFTKHIKILIPSFVYFFIMLFFLNHEGEMGWYMIVMFPFFSILTSALLVESIRKNGLFILTVSIFAGMFIAQYFIDLKYGLTNLLFRLYLIILLLPLIGAYLLRKQKLMGFLSNVWFYILILITMYISYYYIHPL